MSRRDPYQHPYQLNPRRKGIFPDTAFNYDPQSNTCQCPAGQTLRPRRLHPVRRTWEFTTAKGICAACHLRSQCTRACYGRTIKRHEYQALLERARGQAHSPEAYRDRCRRKHLAEGSFADAANNYHFKRSRWRRLWRQQIQDYLIGAIQNVKIIMRNLPRRPLAAIQYVSEAVITRCFAKVSAVLKIITAGYRPYKHVLTEWVPV